MSGIPSVSGWALALRLARRDLRARFRGLRLLFICLFLGVASLAAIGSLASAVQYELSARGQILLGGDVQFEIGQRRAEQDERAAIAAFGTVSETIRMQSMAIRDTQTAPVELKAVDRFYPLYGRLRLADGRVVSGLSAEAVLIDSALADRLSVRTGDRLRFGGARFQIAGLIAEEPDRLGEGFTLGPVAIVSLDGLARTGLMQPGSLYKSRYRVRMQGNDPEMAAAAFKKRFADAGWEMRTRDAATPGASRFVGRMGTFLSLVGLAALAIAGIGIGSSVASYLSARRNTIAMLKVMGATSRIVARIYLIEIAVVAIIGILFGLIVGAAATPALVLLAGDVLPVAPSTAIQPLPLALAASYGLLIALGAAAVPLVRGADVPAAALLRGAIDGRSGSRLRAAGWIVIAGTGIFALVALTAAQPQFSLMFLGAVMGVLLLLAALGVGIRYAAARVPRPRRPLIRLAIAGLYRPDARTIGLVVSLGLPLTLFVMLAAIRTSLDANIARNVPARAPALFALDVPRDRLPEFVQTIEQAAGAAEVASVPLLRGTVISYGTTRVADLAQLPEGAFILRGGRGITYADRVPLGSRLTAGEWWPRDYAGPPLVSVEVEQAKSLGLSIGDPLSVSVMGQEVTARVASFRSVQWDTMGFNFVLVFSPSAFAEFPHNLSATVNMPPARTGAVMRALLPRFPSVSVIEVGGILKQVRDVVGQLSTAISAAASVAIFAGIAVLIGAITAARDVRTYDAVMLKVLGATRAQILGAQGIEYALLSIIVAAIALMLGLIVGWYVVVQLFTFEWLPDYGSVLLTLGVGAGITLLIGLLGSLPILSARPAQALRSL
jgi:putative ABC transport system permease protein